MLSSRNRSRIPGLLAPLLAALLMAAAVTAPAEAQVRIKDIADFEGVRDNQLIGYGLVVGLNGTGDDLSRSIFTRESLIGMLDLLDRGQISRDTFNELQDILQNHHVIP